MDSLDLELPDEEGREWLLDGLARLVKLRGYQQLVGAPILLPENQYFPDAWQPGPRGARVLLRRLLRYAGLADMGVALKLYKEANFSQFDLHGVGHAGPGTAAWFAGIEDGTSQFGINVRELRDEEELVGTLGHEVAHAFRYQHGIVVSDPHVEERLTDLTSVYLGFGVFLLNSSHSFKTGGYSEAGDRLLFETKTRGYLAPPQIALLLGAQAMAREIEPKEKKRILLALSANHAKLFEDACEVLGSDPAGLRRRLGIPEPGEWQGLPRIAELTGPLTEPDVEGEPDDDGEIDDGVSLETASLPSPAFRIAGSYRGLLAAAGAILPFVVGTFGFIDGWPLVAASLGGAGIGALIGSALARDRCSGCGARLTRRAARCRRCGASLVAVVRNADERLAAEEELERSASATPADSEPDEEPPLIAAMYAAWVIEHELVSEEFAEQHAEVVVALHCGNYETAKLVSLWPELPNALTEIGVEFFDYYFGGKRRPADEDYLRLTTGVRLEDTRASYRRVASVLDARFEAWLERTGSMREPADSS